MFEAGDRRLSSSYLQPAFQNVSQLQSYIPAIRPEEKKKEVESKDKIVLKHAAIWEWKKKTFVLFVL